MTRTSSCSFRSLLTVLLLFLPASSFAQTLVPSPQNLPGTWAGSLAWGDYDNDGLPDLLLTGLTGPKDGCAPITRIYHNDGGTLRDINAGLTGVYLGQAAWGDYDGDGDLDVAVSGLTAQGQGFLKIYRNDDGHFVEDTDQTQLQPVRYSALAWGDYDNDGDLDLVVSGMTAGGSPSTVLYRNTRIDRNRIGSPLGGKPLLEVDGPNTERLLNLDQGSLAWGDYNGDGDLDLALSGFGAGGTRQTVLYLNHGGNLFQDNSNTGLEPVSGGSLAWGDYDNDGDLDLAVSGWNSAWEAVLKLYTNAAGILRENPSFSSTRVLGPLAWGDYDGDGDLDLAVSGQTSASDRFAFILKNDPVGTLREDGLQHLTGLRGGAIAWADINGDGRLDLAISGEDSSGTRQTLIYTGSGPVVNAPPSPPTALGRPIVTGSGVTLNWNDGTDPGSTPSALTYTLRIGTTPGGNDVFSGAVPVGPGNVGSRKTVQLAIPLARGTYYWAVRTVDDGDRVSPESPEQVFRVQDLVSSQQSIRALQNSAMAWGDFDNDGDLDLAITGRDADGNTRALVYRNNGGTLVEDSHIVLQGVQNGDIAWGDFDNDGNLDLALTGSDAAGNRYTHVYRNRLASGDFALVTGIVRNLPQLANSSLAWGDVDNDGDLDLILMGTGAGKRVTQLFLNQGGTLVEDTSQHLVGMDNGDLAWCDYDNDGDLDLATIGQVDDQNHAQLILYRNDPLGTLTPDTRSSFTGLLASSLAWGDYDNDGDADLAVCGYSFTDGLVTRIYKNDGTGVFTDSGIVLPGVAAGDLAWGDYDNDGDLDLALVGQAASGQVLQVYRNNGDGTFEQVPMDVLTGLDFASVSWADYDNNGGLDLISSGRASPDPTTFLPVSRINDNLESRFNPNRQPVAPGGLAATTQGDEVVLRWDPSTDVGVSNEALTYALRVGTEPGGNQIRSGAAPLSLGRIRRNEYYLTGLKSGHYYWAVRAIDKGMLSSPWSAEGTFLIDVDKPVVDSVRVEPRVLNAGTRATVLVAFQDQPAGMDNTVSPRVSLQVSGESAPLVLQQLSFNGNLWIGETQIQNPVPGGTILVHVEGAADRKGNTMNPYQAVIPALVVPGLGGVVESPDGIVDLTVFPSLRSGDLPQNPSVEIHALPVENPPSGVEPVGQAYEIVATPAFEPRNTSTLSFAVGGASDPSQLAVYRLDGTTWSRVGGTLDSASGRIRAPVSQFGTFALFREETPAGGSQSVSNIQFSNRAFSPRGQTGLTRPATPLLSSTDISFNLGAAAVVRIEIYNRSGRLQRVLESGRRLGPGRQVFTWDGRDSDNRIVRSGLYIVVIDADGHKAEKTLAVVNN